MIKPFFHEEPYDAVRVEDEIASFGVFVSNHAAEEGVLAEKWRGTESNVPTLTMQ